VTNEKMELKQIIDDALYSLTLPAATIITVNFHAHSPALLMIISFYSMVPST